MWRKRACQIIITTVIGLPYMPGHYDKGIKTPTQKTIPIHAQTTSGVGVSLVRVPRELSVVNNRLYRNCRTYDVKFAMNATQTASSSGTRIELFTLPNTWFCYGAIRYAYRMYMQSHADELAAGVKFAKWHDFKINEQNPDATWDYHTNTFFDGDGFETTTPTEEVPDSSVTDSGGTSRGFHVLGNIANSYNIFREYAELLNYRHAADESVSSTQPYGDLLDLDDADAMAEKGDQPPYSQNFASFLPADEVVDDDSSTGFLVLQDAIAYDFDGGGGKHTSRVFTAPLGLVWARKTVVSTITDFSNTPEMSLIASSGSYKGVKSFSLTG